MFERAEILGFGEAADLLILALEGKADFEAVRTDVAELKDTNKWLFRLVMGIIITAVIGTVIAVGGLR